MSDFTVIGVPPEAAEYLSSGQDLCFGRHFAKTNTECISCRAPVILQGKVVLMRDVCAMKCSGKSTPAKLNRLTSTQVMERIERGTSVKEMFKEILGESDPAVVASAARQMLIDRLTYLKTIGVETPEVPKTKDLLKEDA